MGSRRVFGSRDLYQFNLFELVLANHAADILAVGPGLAPEAWRVAHPLQRQTVGFNDLVPHQIGHRDLRRRDQIIRRIAHQLEQVRFELRQLAGAAQAVGVDHERHVGLDVTVLGRMHVEHELGQGTLQTSQRALQGHKTRTGNLDRRLKVHSAQCGAQIEVLLWRNLETTWLAPAEHLAIVGIARAIRHVPVQYIRDVQQQVLEFPLDRVELLLVALQLVAEALHLGQQRRYVLASGLGLSDAFRTGVPLALKFLSTALDRLAAGFQFGERRCVELKAPARELLGHGIEVGAN